MARIPVITHIPVVARPVTIKAYKEISASVVWVSVVDSVTVSPIVPYTKVIFGIYDPVMQPVVAVSVCMIVPVPAVVIMRPVFVPPLAIGASIANDDRVVICRPMRRSLPVAASETAGFDRYIAIA